MPYASKSSSLLSFSLLSAYFVLHLPITTCYTSRCPSPWPTEIRNGNLKAILGLFFSLSRYKQQQQAERQNSQPSLPPNAQSQSTHSPLSQQSSAPAQLGQSPHGTPALTAQKAAQAEMQSRWGMLAHSCKLETWTLNGWTLSEWVCLCILHFLAVSAVLIHHFVISTCLHFLSFITVYLTSLSVSSSMSLFSFPLL